MVAWWNLFQGTIVVVAFGEIDRWGFGIAKWNQCLTDTAKAWNYGGADKDRRLLGKISKRAKPKSNQRPTGLKKTFLKIEKVFQA